MKILMAILFIVLMIGVTPAFAAESHANQQTVTSAAVKINNDINNASDVADEDKGYIDGYDDDGNYIGYYNVVDPSNSTSDEDDDYSDGLDDQSDDTGAAVVSSFGTHDVSDEDGDYVDEFDNMANSSGMDKDSDDKSDVDDTNPIDNSNDTVDESDVSGDYNDEPDGGYITGELDVSTQPDENNGLDQPDDQFDESGYYTGTKVIEYDDPYADQLNEDIDELDGGNYTVVDSLDQQSGDESTSQVDENVSTTSKPLIVTIVNGLCGAVQATLEGLGNVCVVLGNELEAVL